MRRTKSELSEPAGRRAWFYAVTAALWLVALAVVAKVSLDRVSVPLGGNPASSSAAVEGTGEAGAGRLQSRPFYGLRTRDKARLLLDRMAEGRPYLLGVERFYVALAVAYAGILFIFLWQLARAILHWGAENP